MARSEPSPLSALFKTVSVLGKARHSNASTRGTKRRTAGRCARQGSRREAVDFRFADGHKPNQTTRYIADLLYGWKTLTENLSAGHSPTLVPPVVLRCLLLNCRGGYRSGG